jgi:hypothetical protein
MGILDEEPEDIVGCMTADFAMQVIYMQGLL